MKVKADMESAKLTTTRSRHRHFGLCARCC